MRNYIKPNILIIYTDQQRLDSLRCYGNEKAITPNIDALAINGALIKNYYVQNPVCMSSRMSFLTGRYCSSIGIGTNGIPFPEDAAPINQILKPYGYTTAQIGKLHFQPHAVRDHRDTHPDYGFDSLILSDEPGCYDDAYTKWVESIDPTQLPLVRTTLPPAALPFGRPEYSHVGRNTHEPYIFEGDEDLTHSAFVTSEICNFIKKNTENPFFAIAGFYAPHTPINPPKRFVEMYNIDEMPLPIKADHETWADELKDITDQEWQKIVAYYMAFVSHVDDCVGQIVSCLKEQQLLDNTIVVFTTDHGEYLGDHGRIQKGMPGHDCIVKVPCIIHYPNAIQQSTNIDGIVEAVDIVPTLLDYAGIQIPSNVQGNSIKNSLNTGDPANKDAALVEFFDLYGPHQSALCTKEYKYCVCGDAEILYDLTKDPKELENVISDSAYSTVLSDLRLKMIQKLHTAAYHRRNKVALY